MLLPVLNGILFSIDDIILSPTFIPSGARIYLFSESLYSTKAILDDLFGSYSIEKTSPLTSNLFLLK